MIPRAKISLPLAMKILALLITFPILGASALGSKQSESTSSPSSTGETRMDEVVRKAQSGDEASFNTLYQSYYAQIYRHLLRLVGNHEEASDLAVETFLKAWRGLPGLDDVLRFRSWLFSIATHTGLDFLRKRKGSISSWECLSEDHLDENAVRFTSHLEERELVELALQEVAPKPLACLLLQLEGFSLAEIAELMGLEKNSAGTYVSIARNQFRKAYNRLANL